MLRSCTWEKCREKVQRYRRRSPEQSALYRVVYHGRDELARVWADRFQPVYGVLRDEVLSSFDEYLVAFSCKKRGVCPSCDAKRAVKFAEHLYDEVLESVPNRHVVFTIPKRLRVYFRYDRALNTILFKSAWGAVKEVLGTDTGTPAAVLTLQTAGESLNFHPHLHGCVADGLFAADGEFLPFVNVDQTKLTQVFAERVLSALHKRELINDDDVAQILSQEHSGFSVWVGESFQDAQSSRFVARYIETRTTVAR